MGGQPMCELWLGGLRNVVNGGKPSLDGHGRHLGFMSQLLKTLHGNYRFTVDAAEAAAIELWRRFK